MTRAEVDPVLGARRPDRSTLSHHVRAVRGPSTRTARPMTEHTAPRLVQRTAVPSRQATLAGPRHGRPGRTALLALSGVAFVILGLSAAHGVRGPSRTRVVPVRPVDDPESIDRIGLACLARGDLEGAERWWLQSAEADPHRGDPWLRLGQLALHRREPGEAIPPLNRALTINPHCYQALHGLAAAHGMLGHDVEARDFRARATRAQRALPPPTGGMGADAPPVPPERLHELGSKSGPREAFGR